MEAGWKPEAQLHGSSTERSQKMPGKACLWIRNSHRVGVVAETDSMSIWALVVDRRPGALALRKRSVPSPFHYIWP